MTGVSRGAILLVGDELLTGYRRDEIGPRVASRLDTLGCQLTGLQIVPDDVGLIAAAVRGFVGWGIEVVIVAGGLGPTEDDCTRRGVAEALDVGLELDEDALRRIEERYARRGREMPQPARQQAMFPAGAERLPNTMGTAPGFLVRAQRTMIAVLPGVPREFDEMFRSHVTPVLAERLAGGSSTASCVLHLAGVSEAEIHRSISENVPAESGTSIKYLAHAGELELIVTARAEEDDEAARRLAGAVEALEAHLGEVVYGRGEGGLVTVLRDLLAERRWTLATAESCTGGLVGKMITDLPGASSFYLGGVVAYNDREKQALLDVPAELLESFGAVSSEVARAMADGCRRRLDAAVALSVTGIAGPEGGGADKPVGLVYVGVATPQGARVFRHTMSGERGQIRQRSAVAVFDEARRVLCGLPPHGVEVEPEGA